MTLFFHNFSEFSVYVEQESKRYEELKRQTKAVNLKSQEVAVACYFVSQDKLKSFQVFALGVDGSLFLPCPRIRYPDLFDILDKNKELRLICGYALLDCVKNDIPSCRHIVQTFNLSTTLQPARSPSVSKTKSRCHFLSPIEEGRIKLSVSPSKKKVWKYEGKDYKKLVCSSCTTPISTLQDGEHGVATLKSYLLTMLYKEYHIFAFICDDCRDTCEMVATEGQPNACMSCFERAKEDELFHVPIRYDRKTSRGQAIVVSFCPTCFSQPQIMTQLENLRYLEQSVVYPK